MKSIFSNVVTLFDANFFSISSFAVRGAICFSLFVSSIRIYDAWFLTVAELITVVSLAASIAQLIGTTVKDYK